MNISESPAVLTVDIPITWYSTTAETLCECRLRIYKITFDKAVVIISELEDYPDRSIKEELSTLIHLVCDDFKLSPAKTMWLEHYPAKHLQEKDIYEQVMLVQPHIYSTRISKQKIEALLGVKL